MIYHFLFADGVEVSSGITVPNTKIQTDNEGNPENFSLAVHLGVARRQLVAP